MAFCAVCPVRPVEKFSAAGATRVERGSAFDVAKNHGESD